MQRATIYPSLWQPILTAGVPRDYAIFAIIFSAILMAIIRNRLIGFSAFGLSWAIGWFFAKIDPEFFTLFLVRRLKIGRTKGTSKGNLYHA